MHRRPEAQEGADFLLLRFLQCARAGTETLDLALFEAEVSRRAIGEEVVTVRDEMVVQFVEELLGGGAVAGEIAIDARPAAGPVSPPVKGPDHAIGVTRSETRLPLVHPFGIAAEHSGNDNKQISPQRARRTEGKMGDRVNCDR